MRSWIFWVACAVMLAVVITTWGSIGSGLTLFGLIMLIGTNVTYYCRTNRQSGICLTRRNKPWQRTTVF